MSKVPQKSCQNSDVKKEYEIEPEPSLKLKPFESFPKYPNIESLQQFYKSFLQKNVFLAQQQSFLKQFNILSQEQKGYTIRRVKLFIQKLQKQKLAKEYDPIKINQMIVGFRIFQFELNRQIIKSKNNRKKQSNQSIKPRTKFQKLKQTIKQSQIIKIIKAIIVICLLISQCSIFQGSWTIGKGFILGLGIIYLIIELVLYFQKAHEKWRELSEQQQERNGRNKNDLQKQKQESSIGLQKSRGRGRGKIKDDKKNHDD